MTDTAVLPDIELLVCRRLAAALGGGAAVGTTLVGWRAGQPHVQVRRTGGSSRYHGWLDSADIAVEVRHATREQAAALAAEVRAALAATPAGTEPGTVVTRVVERSGPGWTPDPDGGGRYRLLWTIDTHPARPRGKELQ